jgi:sugar O-acyltransferase (sialic acid O-acetyltransferase NeuD family)
MKEIPLTKGITMNKILIIGAGGHASVVAQAINYGGDQSRLILGFLDDFKAVGEKFLENWEILGAVSEAGKYIDAGASVFIAVGDNFERRRIAQQIGEPKHYFSVVHPLSRQLGGGIKSGCFIAAGAVIGVNCKVGSFSIINTNASLDHDGVVGDFCHLAPGVTTGGRVKIGNGTFVGISAAIRDGVSVGSNCIIGMCSVVTRNIPDNCIAWGNPCRIKKHQNV